MFVCVMIYFYLIFFNLHKHSNIHTKTYDIGYEHIAVKDVRDYTHIYIYLGYICWDITGITCVDLYI